MAEKIALTDEQDYLDAQAILAARKRPPQALRVLMQALENYRQAKKMGWSRPWNKDNVVNFQSFRLNSGDLGMCKLAYGAIRAEAHGMPDEASRFVAELLAGGPPPMGFVFFQEYTDGGRRYEGAVVSYGRVNVANKRFRDRMDLILESEVVDGVSQGLSRVRLYVDPYLGPKEPLWQQVIGRPSHPETARLFAHLAGLSWAWASTANRLWTHWITDYIDYFGARKWDVQKSYFHTGDPASRIMVAENADAVGNLEAA